MKNNKGFSLVEVLGVIVVLALLTLASFTILDGVNRRNKNKAEEVQINNIINSAIAYAPTSDVKLPDVEASSLNTLNAGRFDFYGLIDGKPKKTVGYNEKIQKVCISLEYLQFEGIIEDNIVSPKTGEIYEIPSVCILLVSLSTKDSIEAELKRDNLKWRYDGSYLYYFEPGGGVISVLG